MSNRIIVLSKRPAKVKKIVDIDIKPENLSPLQRRESPNFRLYFNTIWKEMDSCE